MTHASLVRSFFDAAPVGAVLEVGGRVVELRTHVTTTSAGFYLWRLEGPRRAVRFALSCRHCDGVELQGEDVVKLLAGDREVLEAFVRNHSHAEVPR